MSAVLAAGYWLWAGFIAIGAGGIGSALNCEHGCTGEGDPSWLEPWTWSDHDVYPRTLWIGLTALVLATAFVVLVFLGRRLLALVALAGSLVLISYPFFAGTTAEGWWLAVPGLLLGLGSLGLMQGQTAPRHAAP